MAKACVRASWHVKKDMINLHTSTCNTQARAEGLRQELNEVLKDIEVWFCACTCVFLRVSSCDVCF